MTLYTGKGDQGTTKLFDTEKGVRISKASAVFECLGTLDECNSIVGLCKSKAKNSGLMCGKISIHDTLHEVQNHLFTLQAEIAGAEKTITTEGVQLLEKTIHHIEQTLPEITSFFVPGSSELSAYFDVARTIARRAERTLVSVAEESVRNPSKESLAYMNRLSSLLYALARYVAHAQGLQEQAPEYR